MINANSRLPEITIITLVNIHELLWVAVGQWEPAALDLDHQAMPFFERMRHIRQFKFYLLDLIGFKCFRYTKAFAKTATHNFTTYQHLITTHGYCTTSIAPLTGCLTSVFKIIGKYIDHFYYKVGIGGRN